MGTFVKFSIDGEVCMAEEGMRIIDAARENRIFIPSLCNYPGVPPKGSCRKCAGAGRKM